MQVEFPGWYLGQKSYWCVSNKRGLKMNMDGLSCSRKEIGWVGGTDMQNLLILETMNIFVSKEILFMHRIMELWETNFLFSLLLCI